MKSYYVYIIANKRHGTIYVGFTGDLKRRIADHKEGRIPGFTKRYGCKTLVWYQEFSSSVDAIATEKRLKNWKRDWKIELIESVNPEWKDQSDWFGD
ncbi:MAG TPA: GIY-YIG nuclease family protein [Candidatus Syntrophosphaera sp.]|jgi:putative endonuclease|nr:GIY-YIG nuclease family protein [Candidatus Syntrophosphaera sp.]HPW39005.1 GIY-YIG nuclease family protein [Candidatus Syntrophosphaera sp.]HQG94631.1 GIY-YIG nuclease family protein [Candidatus Syntrophosphaera sp.]HQK29207.1 GIY-YIG nuclease family protein [Candidatus Syntrophosphaera sp.]HQO68438.1 GIY-YIG nuclease family protein [Candidatus Syntrophosphaera sp.]